jgi:DNA-binding LacI/PurR family transcriptional regulator
MANGMGAHPIHTSHRGGFITSADVAVRAGVSRSAVSRTFTPGASVSPEVKRKVIAAADELGYRVNRLARGLISAHSNLVGIISSGLDKPFAAGLLSSTAAALGTRGLQALMFEHHGHPEDVDAEIQRILEYRVEAIIVMSGWPSSDVVDECAANGVTLVLVNRPAVGQGSYAVSCDDFGGATLAADRLINSGHKRLAVVGSESGSPSQVRRIAGFVERAKERGLPVEVVKNARTNYESGKRGAHDLFDRGGEHHPDGVFCTTDLLAAGFLDVIRHDYGLRVPRDVSVIGYDDIPQAAWDAYQLTTLRQCPHDLAQAIVRGIRSDDRSIERSAIVGASLVERNTVRA